MIGRRSDGGGGGEREPDVPADDARDPFYGGEPPPWETATHRETHRETYRETYRTSALGIVPETRTNAAATSIAVHRRAPGRRVARAARRAALGRRHGPAGGDASMLGSSADLDTDERAADARRERYAGVALAALEKALTQASAIDDARGRSRSAIGSCPTPLGRSRTSDRRRRRRRRRRRTTPTRCSRGGARVGAGGEGRRGVAKRRARRNPDTAFYALVAGRRRRWRPSRR